MFRYLEKLIDEIGAIDSDRCGHEVSGFLQCEDTYPDFDANRRHFQSLLERLRLSADDDNIMETGRAQVSRVQRWLVHLLWHKLIFHSQYEENFAKLVGMRATVSPVQDYREPDRFSATGLNAASDHATLEELHSLACCQTRQSSGKRPEKLWVVIRDSVIR